jgi:hypothetical protein
LSGVVDAADMLEPSNADKFMEEVGRYLAAVDLFRELACEPTWRTELSSALAQPHASVVTTRVLDAGPH